MFEVCQDGHCIINSWKMGPLETDVSSLETDVSSLETDVSSLETDVSSCTVED